MSDLDLRKKKAEVAEVQYKLLKWVKGREELEISPWRMFVEVFLCI